MLPPNRYHGDNILALCVVDARDFDSPSLWGRHRLIAETTSSVLGGLPLTPPNRSQIGTKRESSAGMWESDRGDEPAAKGPFGTSQGIVSSSAVP